MMKGKKMSKTQGFTLIEVLISMMILAVGLLGLAALQATGLRNNLSAYNRSQATQLAYDLADRMRANSADTGTLAASTYNTMSPTAAVVQNNCKLVANACTPAQMAQNDLFEWNRAIAGGPAVVGPPVMVAMPATLPLGQGIISGDPIGDFPNQKMLYTITINWDDNRDGCVNPGDAGAGCAGKPNDPNFQMRFQL